MMKVDWTASKWVGWLSYTWETSFVRSLQKYWATVWDHGKATERLISIFAVVCLKSFICSEDTRSELRIYRGEFVSDRLLATPIEAVTEYLDAAYDGNSNDGNWKVAKLELNPCSGLVDRSREFVNLFVKFKSVSRRLVRRFHRKHWSFFLG